MRRMSAMGIKRAMSRAAIFVGAAMALAAGPVAAVPASLDPIFGWQDTNLGDLPAVTFDGESPIFGAGRAGSGAGGADPTVVLGGSTDVCILPSGGATCQADLVGITGPYSMIVSLEVISVNTTELGDRFTLLLGGLPAGSPYVYTEVEVELDPVLPTGFDDSQVPGFEWNGVFTDFVHVIDETDADVGAIYDFIGFTVGIGDVVAFQIDVLTAPDGRVRPELGAGAVAPIVPEPGTAILFGLGLAGLTVSGRRRNA